MSSDSNIQAQRRLSRMSILLVVLTSLFAVCTGHFEAEEMDISRYHTVIADGIERPITSSNTLNSYDKRQKVLSIQHDLSALSKILSRTNKRPTSYTPIPASCPAMHYPSMKDLYAKLSKTQVRRLLFHFGR